MSFATVFPWECRDKEDQARAVHAHPLRRAHQSLAEENLRLKRILRENGIAWSPVARAHLAAKDPAKSRARPSTRSVKLRHPYLPMEVLLRILKFAMTSAYPIIDPLWPATPENLTEEEKSRGPQIAINFLASCKAINVEGSKILWEDNTFTFTTPHAVRNFAELKPEFRHKITHVNFRIIAQYYDDVRRKHKLHRNYHWSLSKDVSLRVSMRPREPALTRGGFRCYTWKQILDFLAALRAPYNPGVKIPKQPRPRLLPALASLRLDLVNFSDVLLPYPDQELHDLASHELGCTLNEIQVTGMPADESGLKASAELSGLLKDEGLYLSGAASFMAQGKHLTPLPGKPWLARVVRACSEIDDEELEFGDDADYDPPFGRNHPRLNVLPAAPAEEGREGDDFLMWKRVPTARDETTRVWSLFCRITGHEVHDYDEGDEEDEIYCPACGDVHTSFADFIQTLHE
jgi:hypothetical protein